VGGRRSRVQERDVGEEGLYLCGARGGAVRGRESDGAPYPIGKAAISGCSDSMFDITKETVPYRPDENLYLPSEAPYS
jgi:hypothetical protein